MDENLIKQWAASPNVTEQIAADFARKIANGSSPTAPSCPPTGRRRTTTV